MRGAPCAPASGHSASASRPALRCTARVGWRCSRAGPRRPAWRASWQCLRQGITRSRSAGHRGGRSPPWPRAARARRSGARGSSAASSACIKACRRGSRAARSSAPGLHAMSRRPALLLTHHHARSCSNMQLTPRRVQAVGACAVWQRSLIWCSAGAQVTQRRRARAEADRPRACCLHADLRKRGRVAALEDAPQVRPATALRRSSRAAKRRA